MGLFSEHGPCLEHDHETLRPIIVSTWMPEKVGGLPGKSLVFAESQVSFYFANDLISLQHARCFNQNKVEFAVIVRMKFLRDIIILITDLNAPEWQVRDLKTRIK